MRKHHRITKKEQSFDDVINSKNLIKTRVLSKNGLIVGKVSQLRIHPRQLKIEGILVTRGLFKQPLYIGSSYIERFSDESFILKVDPSVLIKGKKVINAQGKRIGKVKEIIRKGHTNKVKEIIVKNIVGKKTTIKMSQIKLLGENIILK